MRYKNLLLLFLFPVLTFGNQTEAQTALKSPAEFLGYELGEQWTPHFKVIGYFRHVAESSPMADLNEYGTSYEGRELVYVTVSTAENIAKSEEIRTDNLKRAGLMDGAPRNGNIAIVWLSYNVHGNETSSSEAAMKTIYELVRPGNKKAQNWLRETLVIIDPMLNPDGRDRYIHWFNETAGDRINIHKDAREHHEPWPGGRTNHYYFDLNRDWTWLIQKETRLRMEAYQQWLPHIHVDFHEQSYTDPYYFAPAAEPFHPAITDWQIRFQYTIGKNHARYFDKNNWLYFTRERFDLFYPGYGDTYPIFNGSIGMTYEQAGHGRAGLGIALPEGDTLTLKDRLTHHYTTGISTVEITARHAGKVVEEFAEYYRQSANEPGGDYKSFVIKGDNDPDKLRDLFAFLDRHRVKYGKVPSSRNYSGYNYRTGEVERVTVTDNDYVISVFQPKSVLARVLFEPRPKLTDSLTYDITAWEQHYAYGLEGYAIETRINPVQAEAPGFDAPGPRNGTPYAYLAEWHTLSDLRFLASLLDNGIKVRFTRAGMTHNQKKYEPGTLIITRSDNKNLGGEFDRLVNDLAVHHKEKLDTLQGGFTDSGPDLGSDAVRFLEKPEIALLSGAGTSSGTVGEVWHFFDKQIDYPVTLLDTGYFDDVDLYRYDVLILPGGRYSEILDDEILSEIREWISSGGRLIALRKANRYLSGKEGFNLKVKEVEQETPAANEQVMFSQRQRDYIQEFNSGTVYRIDIDNTHPLGFGYGDAYFSLKLDSKAYAPLENGWNVGMANENAHMSGFIGHEAEEKLSGTLTFGVQALGEGAVVYMVDNPLFRGFWHNGKLLFGNAVFMVGQ